MALFSRRDTPRPVVAGNEDAASLDHQDMAMELADAWSEHDAVGLAALTREERAEQYRARKLFYEYVDRIWEDAKARGLNPAVRPEWLAVAGMRDLTMALWEQAVQAQTDAGDDE